MQRLIALAFLAVLCAAPATSGRQGRPIPPGIREADKQTNKPLEPPAGVPQLRDPSILKREADELAQLSASVPSDVGLVAKGQLPRDLADKLKRIEKLAKHLRTELSQ